MVRAVSPGDILLNLLLGNHFWRSLQLLRLTYSHMVATFHRDIQVAHVLKERAPHFQGKGAGPALTCCSELPGSRRWWAQTWCTRTRMSRRRSPAQRTAAPVKVRCEASHFLPWHSECRIFQRQVWKPVLNSAVWSRNLGYTIKVGST